MAYRLRLILRALLVAFAAGLGASPRPPETFRHEDAVAQIAGEEGVESER